MYLEVQIKAVGWRGLGSVSFKISYVLILENRSWDNKYHEIF